MDKLFFSITTVVGIFFMNAQETRIKNVNSAEFQKLIKKKNGILLDVRTLYEFEEGHIRGAYQLNYYAFSFKKTCYYYQKTSLFTCTADLDIGVIKLQKF